MRVHPTLTAIFTATTILFSQSGSQAQVFEGPVLDFELVPAPGQPFLFFIPAPTTLDVGEVDGTVKSDNGLPLNDIAIMGRPSVEIDENQQTFTVTGRSWTIIHDDPEDTRSLVLAENSDIVFNAEDNNYLNPSTLQIMDLNGDGQNDLAFLDSVPLSAPPDDNAGVKFAKAPSEPANIKAIPGKTSQPFFATHVDVIGSQTNGTAPAPQFFGGGGQPGMARGDFNGDGRPDLGIYDFLDGSPGQDLLASLLNQGNLDNLPLPRMDTNIVVAPEAAGRDAGSFLVGGDFDQDGLDDIAIVFDSPEDQVAPGSDRLAVYLGMGNGAFSSEPTVDISLNPDGVDYNFQGLVAGDFDGNGLSDFAVIGAPINALGLNTQIHVLFCQPGTPSTCSTELVSLPGQISINLAAGDFDSDGLDDLALSYFACVSFDTCLNENEGAVQVFLNKGANFLPTPDQTLLMGGDKANRLVAQVVAKDIDGCGGPDLAYVGQAGNFIFPEKLYASVAFTPNEDPKADAGAAVLTKEGIQVGGDPTCFDIGGDNMVVEWAVLSGEATISDSSASNPFVTFLEGNEATLQVTCTDACGATASDTVLVSPPALLEGAGCAMGGGAFPLGFAMPFAFIIVPLTVLRRGKK